MMSGLDPGAIQRLARVCADVEYCEQHAQHLNGMDIEFLAGFLLRTRKGEPLTPKQRAVLERMLQTVDEGQLRERRAGA
jgi:hypothetical protein